MSSTGLLKEDRTSDASNDGGGGSNSTGYEEVEYIEEVVFEEVEEEGADEGQQEAVKSEQAGEPEAFVPAMASGSTQSLDRSNAEAQGEQHASSKHPQSINCQTSNFIFDLQ